MDPTEAKLNFQKTKGEENKGNQNKIQYNKKKVHFIKKQTFKYDLKDNTIWDHLTAFVKDIGCFYVN